MTRIESRPSASQNFDYDFFLDFESHEGNESQVEKMLQELRDTGVEVRKISGESSTVSEGRTPPELFVVLYSSFFSL